MKISFHHPKITSHGRSNMMAHRKKQDSVYVKQRSYGEHSNVCKKKSGRKSARSSSRTLRNKSSPACRNESFSTMSCFLFTDTCLLLFGWNSFWFYRENSESAIFFILTTSLPRHGCATLMAQLCHTDGTAVPLGWHDCAIKVKILGTIYL